MTESTRHMKSVCYILGALCVVSDDTHRLLLARIGCGGWQQTHGTRSVPATIKPISDYRPRRYTMTDSEPPPVPEKLRRWLEWSVHVEASDLHLIVGYPPVVRLHG